MHIQIFVFRATVSSIEDIFRTYIYIYIYIYMYACMYVCTYVLETYI